LDIGDQIKLTINLPEIQRYCVKSIDTEGKEHPIFLIIGDFMDFMFIKTVNCPKELIYFIEDVFIFKVQSNINKGWQVHKKLKSPTQGQQSNQSSFAPWSSHCIRKALLLSPYCTSRLTADHLSTSQCDKTQRRHGLEEENTGPHKRNGFMQ
jgi:hypothetical protein